MTTNPYYWGGNKTSTLGERRKTMFKAQKIFQGISKHYVSCDKDSGKLQHNQAELLMTQLFRNE